MIQSGACRLHDGLWSVTVDPVTAVLHRPGASYRTTHPFGLNDTGWSIAVREDVALDLLDRAGFSPERWTRPSMAVAFPGAPVILRPLLLFERTRLGHPVDPLIIEEICIELFRDLVRSIARDEPAGYRAATGLVHRFLAEKTRSYLNEHYSESLRLEEIGRAVGASPAHLCRIFRRHAGVPIRTYLKQLRLAAVLDAVMTGEDPLSQIAVDTGFYSHSHMTSTFAGKLGVPPGEVRRLLGSCTSR